ncbi:hypothetical protein ACMZ4W_02013 [Brevundimonas naejangsanensis]
MAGRDEISVHGDAHGAAGDAPFGARLGEDLVQAFGFGVAADGLRTRDHQHPHARLDLAAAQDVGGGAQIGQAAVGATADEDHIDLVAGGRLSGGEAHVVDGLLVRSRTRLRHGRADGGAGVGGGAPGGHRADGGAVQHDLLVEDRAGISGQSQPVGGGGFIVGGDVATAAQPVDGRLVGGDHAGAGARLDGHVAQGHAPFHVQRAHGLACIFDDVAGAAAEADGGDDGQRHVLAGDAGAQAPVDRHAHGLGPALQQALGRQHVTDFRGADAESQRSEGAVGGGMAVAADDGHARLGQAQFRSHDVDDAALVRAPARQLDPVAGAVDLQRLDLSARLFGDIGQRPVRPGRQGGGRMIQGGEGAVGAADLQSARLDFGKGLRRGDFVDQMQVHIHDAGRLGGFRHDDVPVPHLLIQGLRPAHARAPVRRRRRWSRRSAPASRNGRASCRRTGRGRPC